MEQLVWSDEMTLLAKKNQSYSSWAVVNPNDMLQAVRFIATQDESILRIDQRKELRQRIAVKHEDVFSALRSFGFIRQEPTPIEKNYDETDVVASLTSQQDSNIFYSGEYLSQQGLSYDEAVKAIGHNFLLTAREALEFCMALSKPGRTEEFLVSRFRDRLVFSNKLNPFKFDRLIQILKMLDIIKEVPKYGFVIGYSPAPLTFYCMTERYLLEADYLIGNKVHAGDLIDSINHLLPSNQRSEDFASIGLTMFPFEGWGRYRTWITPESFKGLLNIGLIHPLSVVKILSRLIRSGLGETLSLSNVMMELKKDRIEKTSSFKEVDGLEELLHEYDL